MTAAQQLFVSDPVGFMSVNVLRCQFFDGGVDISKNQKIWLTVKEMKNSPKVVNTQGGKVYYLTDDVTGCAANEMVQVQFIGYKDNGTVTAQLDNTTTLAFTANMDGCSLGVGSQDGNGGCLVTHANKKSVGSANQATAQVDQLKQAHSGEDFWVIGPSTYMDALGGTHLFKGTNFGVNVNGWWMFYTHRWMQMGGSVQGSYTHGGCDEADFMPIVN